MYKTISRLGIFIVTLQLATTSVLSQEERAAESPRAAAIPIERTSQDGWVDLLAAEEFDKRWDSTEFGGEGKVSLENGVLTIGSGQPLTGITAKEQLVPKDNYQLAWKAQRTDGIDFFACVTFPVADEFCSVVVGGWGGGVVGLSSINNNDASENESTQFLSFDNNKWYDFELTVTPEQITFKVDSDPIIEVPRADRKFSTRIEVYRTQPLGYATFQSIAQVKDFKYKDLSKPASKDQSAAAQEKVHFINTVKNDDGIVQSLQTAVAHYEIKSGPYQGAIVDLIGAVHVGEVEYYKELNKRFATYDALLYELVADPDIRLPNRKDTEGVINPISSMQVAMKDSLGLKFQLDEIDYEAANFVHADMSPSEFMADMTKRDDSFLNMFARVLGSSLASQSTGGGQEAALLAAMMQDNPSLALRRVFALQFETSEMQMAGLADSDGLSTLVTERNAKAMSVLQRELKKGKKKVGIFFGAAHLDDMHDKLERDFDAKLTSLEWLDAWHMEGE